MNEIKEPVTTGGKLTFKDYFHLFHSEKRPDVVPPRCILCEHMVENRDLFDSKMITGKIDGKRRKRSIKPLDSWCVNGNMFRINKNQKRWWGFDRRCPLNPYTHTCEVCGTRMCISDTICKSCKKSRQYL